MKSMEAPTFEAPQPEEEAKEKSQASVLLEEIANLEARDPDDPRVRELKQRMHKEAHAHGTEALEALERSGNPGWHELYDAVQDGLAYEGNLEGIQQAADLWRTWSNATNGSTAPTLETTTIYWLGRAIEGTIKKDIPLAVRKLQAFSKMKFPAGGDLDARSSEDQRGLANSISASINRKVGELADPDRVMTFLGQLPDEYPGMNRGDVHIALLNRTLMKMGNDELQALREDKLPLIERFKAAPEVLMHAAYDVKSLGKWKPEESLAFFRSIRDRGERESLLADFEPRSFPKESHAEVMPALVKAYQLHEPRRLLERMKDLRPYFEALPKDEQHALIYLWIDKYTEDLFAFGAEVELDAGDKAKLISTVLGQPFRTYNLNDLGRLKITPEDIADTALETKRSVSAIKIFKLEEFPEDVRQEIVDAAAVESPKRFYKEIGGDVMAGKYQISPEVAQQALEKMLVDGDLMEMPAFEFSTRTKIDTTQLTDEHLAHIKLTDIDQAVENWPEIKERLPWSGLLPKLEKIQGRAAKEKHDVWKTDLDPLVATAFERGLLSPSKLEDGEALIEFIKEFGAVNTPELLNAYLGVSRAKTMEAIPADVRAMLEDCLGKKRVEKMQKPAFLLNELRKYDKAMTTALLKDELPTGIETKLGAEIFKAKIGTSEWEVEGEDIPSVVRAWKDYAEAYPDEAKVPKGYVEKKFTVSVMERGTGKQDEINRVLERPEIAKAQKLYQQHVWEFVDMLSNEEERRRTASGRFMRVADEDVLPALDELGLDETAKRLRDRVAEFGYGMVRTQVVDAAMIDALQAVSEVKNAKALEFLVQLSASHMMMSAPEVFLRKGMSFGALLDQHTLKDGRDFIVDYLNEHYLNSAQDAHKTGHAPFQPELLAALRKAWQIDQGVDQNPAVKAFNDIEALRKSARKAGAKSKDISLVPVHGLLRVYSGDLADACFTSQHGELANGGLEKMQAMVFVTGRGTPKERMNGTVLFIETKTPDGQKVLMVRGNNPRQNLVQELDADELVEKTLAAAIEIAKARKLDIIVVPRDNASESSSNRPAVAAAYQDKYYAAPKVGLVAEPETEFNGYNNWDADGDYPVVKVWERKEEEVAA